MPYSSTEVVKIDRHKKPPRLLEQANTTRSESGTGSKGLGVPRPGGMTEDDGIILSVVLYSKKGNSFLLILDAKSFEEIAKAEAPHQSMISKQPTKCHLKNWIWRKCCQDF